MQALNPLRAVAAIFLVAGLAVVGVGLYKRANLPPEISSREFLSGDKSIDEVAHRNDAEFSAMGWLMGGAFITIVGVGQLVVASRTVRRAGNALIQETAAAVARGVHEGSSTGSTEDRLRQLDELRAKGLVSDSEYDAKRRTILNAL